MGYVGGAGRAALSEFPNLEPLELRHLPRIQQLVARFLPYSDFNAVSLWAWSAAGEFRVAEYLGNLVVEFGEYLTGERFFSLLGDRHVSATVNALLDTATSSVAIAPELRLVPDVVIKALPAAVQAHARPDPDARDYVFLTERYETIEGAALSRLRQRMRQFERAAAARGLRLVEVGACLTAPLVRDLVHMYDRWLSCGTDGAKQAEAERAAFVRLLESISDIADHSELVVTLAIQGDALHGCVIHEYVDDRYGVMHFCKCDHEFSELSSAMSVAAMRRMHDRGVALCNMQQDLGIPGLREHKCYLRPVAFLNKYVLDFASIA